MHEKGQRTELLARPLGGLCSKARELRVGSKVVEHLAKVDSSEVVQASWDWHRLPFFCHTTESSVQARMVDRSAPSIDPNNGGHRNCVLKV